MELSRSYRDFKFRRMRAMGLEEIFRVPGRSQLDNQKNQEREQTQSRKRISKNSLSRKPDESPAFIDKNYLE